MYQSIKKDYKLGLRSSAIRRVVRHLSDTQLYAFRYNAVKMAIHGHLPYFTEFVKTEVRNDNFSRTLLTKTVGK